MTTYRIGDRVVVTHHAHTGAWTGTVVNAHPADDRMQYAVRPDSADPQHPGYTIEAQNMAPAETGGA